MEQIKGQRKLIATISGLAFVVFYITACWINPKLMELKSLAMAALSMPLGYHGANLLAKIIFNKK